MRAIPAPTTGALFRFNMPAQGALNLLAACYKHEVEKRGRRIVFDENTTTALASLAQYIVAPGTKFGVLMCGPCGNGKSTMMRALSDAIDILEKQRHFDFIYRQDEYFRGALDIVKAKAVCEMSKSGKDFEELMRTPLVGIDDLGTEPLEVFDYNNTRTPMLDFLDFRYDRRLFTVVTTNLGGRSSGDVSIRGKYGVRIADRFNEMFHKIVFQNITYRCL